MMKLRTTKKFVMRVVSVVLSGAMVLSGTLFTGETVSFAQEKETQIVLSDSQTTVDGRAISASPEDAVYEGADIIYYEDGHDSSYGDGSEQEAHSESEAAENKVITITQPGTYRISGTLSKGQLAIDLGEDASEDPTAVVNLILDGVDITCTVAPAVIFYNVWESGSTTEAGAVVTLGDDSVNRVNGSHVAKIYKEGTTKKLYKFDGAFYSKMTLNINGESKKNGELHITADNEGLDSEMHMTVDGGKIWIQSQDDGINTNEDDVSVFTVNDGYLYVNAGNGSEGDGIDSNGYITINGGTIISLANASSADGGLDADHDILINGGTVVALGVNNDEVSTSSEAPYLQLAYQSMQPSSQITYLTNAAGKEILAYTSEKTYQSVVLSAPALAFDTTYYLYNGGTIEGAEASDGLYEIGGTYSGGTQQQYNTNAFDGITQPDGTQPDGTVPELPDGTETTQPDGTVPELPDGTEIIQPDGTVPELPDGTETTQPDGQPQMPDGTDMTQPDGTQPDGTQPNGTQPNGTQPNGTQPDGTQPEMPGNSMNDENAVYSTEFTITLENRTFRQITAVQKTAETPSMTVENQTSGESSTDAQTVVSGKTSSEKKVTVKKSAVTKVTRSKNNKKITVKIRKVANADGYQIRYSTSKKFTKGTTKTVTVSKKKLKKTISSLKAKKTYYVSVRAYRKVNGSKYYSAWSAAKTVKAK
jgi:hypothetical protein